MLVKRALGVGPPPNDILQFLPFLSMVDAPYAPCKTSLRCGAAAEWCFTVLSIVDAPYAPCKTSLRCGAAAEWCFTVLSMVDAPYAPCKTSLRCGAAAMGCITVLLWYTRYNYAPLKRALRNNRKGIMIYLFFNITSGNGGERGPKYRYTGT